MRADNEPVDVGPRRFPHPAVVVVCLAVGTTAGSLSSRAPVPLVVVVVVAAVVVGAIALGLWWWQRRLRSDRRFADALFEANATASSLVRASDARYVMVNPAWERLLGYRRDEVIGRTVFDLASPEDHAAIAQRLEDVRAGRFDSALVERDYVRADGSEIRVLQGISEVVGAGGERYYFAQLFDLSAVRAAERTLEAVVGALPDPMFLIDRDGTCRMAHLTADEDPDVSPDMIVGRSLGDLLPPDAAAVASEALASVMSTGERVDLEYTLSWRDGSLHRYLMSLAPCGDGCLIVSRDVTRQHDDAVALAEREGRLRGILGALPDLLVVFDEQGTYLEVVVPEGRSLPHDPEDLVGSTVTDHAPDLADGFLGAIRTALDTGKLATFAYERPGPGGSRSFEARFTSAGDGRVVMLTRDVTEEKARAAELAASLERNAAVFDRTALPLMIMDLEGRFLQVNQASCELFRRSEGEMLTLSAMKLCVPEAREAMVGLAVRLIGGEVAWGSFEAAIRLPDGATVPVIASMSLIHHQDGSPRYLVGQLTDVGDLKAAQAAQEDAEARLRAVFRALPDAVLRVAPDRTIVETHLPESFRRSTVQRGSLHDAQPGASILEILRPEIASELLRAFDEAARSGFGVVETSFPHPDGGIGWRETRITRTDGGEFVVVVRDVSEAKRALQLLAERETLFRTLSDQSPVLVIQSDAAGRCLYANDRWSEIVGAPLEEAYGFGWLSFVHPDDRPHAARILGALQTGAPGFDVRVRMGSEQAGWSWIDFRGTALREDDELAGVIVSGADVTQQMELAREAERLQELLQASTDYVTIATPTGAVLFANQAAALVTPQGSNIDVLLTDESRRRFDEEVLAEVDRSGMWSGELDLHLGGDVVVPVSALVIAGRDDAGELLHLSIVARDISELKEAQRTLAHLASHDSLTGLPNRSLFMERLASVVAGLDDGATAAVLFCDLDGFKAVNDNLGHDAGDDLLVEVAERIRRTVRATDVPARLGGDEFVVLVEDVADRADVLALAHRLVEVVSEPIALDDGEASVGSSVGVAFAAAGDDPDEVLSSADHAMYRAKASGKGTVRVFDPTWSPSAAPEPSQS